MDTKKTNLTPELKEIYDRVMNTPAGSVTSAGAIPTTPPTTVNPMDPPPVDPMATNHSLPANDNPINPLNASTVLPTTPPIVGSAPTLPNAPINPIPGSSNNTPVMPSFAAPNLTLNPPTIDPTPAEQALTSTPARPITEGNTFALGGGHATPAPAAVPQNNGVPVPEKKKAKISLPVIIVLGVVFVAVWGVFWAIIFGFIQR